METATDIAPKEPDTVSVMETSTATVELTSSPRKAGTNSRPVEMPTGIFTLNLNWGPLVSKSSDMILTVTAIPMSFGEWGTNSVCTG